MKILLVEDDEHIAKNIKKGLENKSHVVDLAFNGEEGYDFAVGEEYDLIILDRLMPKMDGIEVCRKLRSEDNSTPILMLTAKTLVEDRVEGLDIGADDYLGKPFAFEELLARVKALGRRPKTGLVNQLCIDDLSLDLNTYQVERGGQPIVLSKKEFTLLEFFMRHPGKVFTKEQLTEEVWEFDADILPNTVQVYIGYLRNKIDRPFPNRPDLIKTINGFGYKLENSNVH